MRVYVFFFVPYRTQKYDYFVACDPSLLIPINLLRHTCLIGIKLLCVFFNPFINRNASNGIQRDAKKRKKSSITSGKMLMHQFRMDIVKTAILLHACSQLESNKSHDEN